MNYVRYSDLFGANKNWLFKAISQCPAIFGVVFRNRPKRAAVSTQPAVVVGSAPRKSTWSVDSPDKKQKHDEDLELNDQLVANCWFGARWFGIRIEIPLSNNPKYWLVYQKKRCILYIVLYISSWELTYPTYGKGKSSSQLPLTGIC